MKDFEFYNPTRIIFGQNSETNLLYELRKYGKRVLMVYGGGSIKKSGLYEVVSQQIREANALCFELAGVQPNPRLSLVRRGIEMSRKNNVDFILAVGGGSVIDTAKAIAAGIVYDGDVADLLMTGATVTKAIPIGVVLTIPAAGSESSSGTVITDDEKTGLKRSFGGEALIPEFAIMNPLRTYSLPKYQTACGCADIIAHLLERYFTTVTDVELTDRLIEGCIKTVLNNAPIALKKPMDYASRSEIMWTGTIAHNNLLNTGRIGDWASHNIEHELSGFNDVAHGAGLAIIFPAWMKYTHTRDMDRFVQLAVRVFDIDPTDKPKEQIIHELIETFETFLTSMGLPIRLREINIKEQDLALLARKAMVGRTQVGQFVPLDEKQILEILTLAL